MAPISALWLFSAAAVTELPRAIEKNAWLTVQVRSHDGYATVTWPLQEHSGLFMLSACLGFFVNICTFLVIKATNSVTLKVRHPATIP